MPHYAVSAAFALVIGLHADLLLAQPVSNDRSRAYVECTRLSETAPERAIRYADGWYEATQDLSAQHCKALALYKLERYDASAAILEGLFDSMGEQGVSLRLSLLLQAAHARRMIGEDETALSHLTHGIALASAEAEDKDILPLLKERAELHVARDMQLEALQDFDHILSIVPEEEAMLMKRAALLEAMGRPEMAMQDYRAVLAVNPKNQDAFERLHQSAVPSPE